MTSNKHDTHSLAFYDCDKNVVYQRTWTTPSGKQGKRSWEHDRFLGNSLMFGTHTLVYTKNGKAHALELECICNRYIRRGLFGSDKHMRFISTPPVDRYRALAIGTRDTYRSDDLWATVVYWKAASYCHTCDTLLPSDRLLRVHKGHVMCDGCYAKV